MAIKRVQFPDGSIHRVEVPDDATNEQIIAFVQSQQGWKPTKRTPADIQAQAQQYRQTHNDASGTFGQNFAAGAGKSLRDTALGVAQLAVNGGPGGLAAQWLAEKAGVPMQRNGVQQYVDNAINANREADSSLLHTGGGLLGYLGGTVATAVAPGAAAITLGSKARAGAGLVNAGRALLAPSTYKGAVALGAVQGLAQPVGEGDSRLANTAIGGVSGGAGLALARGAGAAYNGLRSLLPAARQSAQEAKAAQVIMQYADNPQAVRAALASGQTGEIIPGIKPTLAELTRDTGLSGLQRTLANAPEFGNELTNINLQRNAQRAQFVRNAFNGASEQDANTLKQRATDVAEKYLPDIRKADGVETMRVVKSLDRMANAPIFRNFPETQGFLATARNLLVNPISPEARVSAARSIIQQAAANPGRGSSAAFDALTEARRIVIAGQRDGLAPDEIAKQLKKLSGFTMKGGTAVADALKALRTAEAGKPDVASLYNARKYITQEVMPRLSGQSMLAARSFLSKLDQEITSAAPTYKQYLTEFAGQMRKADQAAVGNALLNKSSASITDKSGNAILSADKIGQSVRNPDALVQQVTGFGRATAAKTLTPEQNQVMRSLAADLSRQATVATEGKAIGSNTVQNAIGASRIQDSMNPVASEALRMAGHVGNAVNIINAMRSQYGSRTAAIVQEAMLNPQRAQALIAQLPANQQAAVRRSVLPLLSSSLAASLLPVVTANQPQPQDYGQVSGHP